MVEDDIGTGASMRNSYTPQYFKLLCFSSTVTEGVRCYTCTRVELWKFHSGKFLYHFKLRVFSVVQFDKTYLKLWSHRTFVSGYDAHAWSGLYRFYLMWTITKVNSDVRCGQDCARFTEFFAKF